ncbi:MAG: hypothetical protein ABJC66_13520 [Gammaproteobacteria bacterium]
MRALMVIRWVGLLALAGALPGIAGGIPGAAASRVSPRLAAATVLAARSDANSLATAAALRFTASSGSAKAGRTTSPDGLTALELAARAGDLAPQNASIGWLRLQLCAATASCDIRDAATIMRWVDADNGAAWLQPLAAAKRQKDDTEVERILGDMAQAARFDFYWNRIVVLMVDALAATRGRLPSGFAGSDSARLSTVSAIASGEIIPPLAPLQDACRESSILAERRELCLKLSKTMQHSDTIAAQLVGFSIEKRLHAPDSKEVRALAERRHILEWRAAAAAKFDDPLLPWTRNARARVRIAHMRALLREEDVCIAILREHKMALEPPEVHP